MEEEGVCGVGEELSHPSDEGQIRGSPAHSSEAARVQAAESLCLQLFW